MEKKLIDFIQRLRTAGVRVSVAESLDAFRAVQVIGIEDRENFRISLRASLIKEVGDYPIFEKLFSLFFSVGFFAPEGQKEANQKIEEERGAERFQRELQEFEQKQKMSEEDFMRELKQMEQKQGAQSPERRGEDGSARKDEESFLKELEDLRRQSGEELNASSNSKASQEAEEQFHKELGEAQKEAPKPSEAARPQEEKSNPSEMKESLNTQGVTEPSSGDFEEESKHGGEEDQHNDVLQQNSQKSGGGESQDTDGQPQTGKEGQAAEGQAKTGAVSQEGQGPSGQEGQVAGGNQIGKEGSGNGQPGQTKELSLSEKIAKALFEGDKSLMSEIAREGAKQVEEINLDSLQSAQSEIGQKLNLWEMRNRLQQELAQQMGDEEANRFLEQAFSKLQKEIASAVEEEAVRRFGEEALDQIMRRPKLEEVDFNNLRYDSNMDLIEEIRVRIAKLARKLASRFSRREKAAKRGKVSIRGTIRKSLQTGGVPLELSFRQRKLAKPELVLLCDVSGSVAVFSEFMLQLVYTLQDKFAKVRSFAFVDRIDEITACFKEDTAAEAIQRARSSRNISWDGYSDFGNSFREFYSQYLEAVTPKTTVIVLGDARNNNNDSQEESLRLIRDRAKKLLWLNPEPAEEWDSGDSIMSTYARVCDQVFECRNLGQLEHVAQEVLK